MSLFNQLGGNAAGQPQPQQAASAQSQQQNPMQLMQQLRQNPVGFLKQAGFNVPENMNNPQQIIQHLMQSGQVTQSRMSQAQQMISRFGQR